MYFYFAILLISFFLLATKKNKNNINVLIVFLILLLLYGLRDYGGVDDFAYISAFNNINMNNVVYGMEKSFIVLSSILGSLGFNYKAVFLLYAVVSFSFMYLAYKNICENKNDWIIAIIGFLVIAFLPTLTLMRQFAATAILSYAFTLKLKGNNKLSLVFIGLASVFHLGALVGFLVFPLFSLKINTITKIILPIISLGIGYSGFFNRILNFLIILIPSKYISYVEKYAYTQPDIGLLHIILIMIYLIQFIIPVVFKKENLSDPTIDFLERLQMIYFSLYFITLSNGWISRLSIYFILFVPFLFKTFISRFQQKDSRLLYMICYMSFILLFIYQILNLQYSPNMSELIPYKGSLNFMD